MENNLQKYKDEKIKEVEQRLKDGIIIENNYKALKELIGLSLTKEQIDLVFQWGSQNPQTGYYFAKQVENFRDCAMYLKKTESINGGGENKLIIGDNYDALNNLLITHKGKIDVIYIDPPYGMDSEREFAKTNYDNKIERDSLLSMLEPRLEIAKQLMSDDGVIFCSLDDKNLFHIKLLFDRIFGENNFWGNLIRRTRHKGGEDGINLAIDHEYCLVFSKNKNVRFSRKNKSEEQINKLYDQSDKYEKERGKFYTRSLDAPSLTYTEMLDYGIKAPDGSTIYAGGVNKKEWEDRKVNHKIRDWRWPWSQERLKKGIELGFIFFKKSKGDKYRVYAKHYSHVNLDNMDEKVHPTNIRKSILENFDNHIGTSLIKQIFAGERAFDFPKPVPYIKELISYSENKNAIILDFFAGSGTTGQAVLELNKEDGGNRKFILCVNNSGNSDEICKERLRRVITGKTKDGKSDFPWIQKNKPLGGGLDVYEIKKSSIFTDDNSLLDSVDETDYDLPKFKNEIKKIEWITNNFKVTTKELKKPTAKNDRTY